MLKSWNVLQWPSQSSEPKASISKACVSLLKTRLLEGNPLRKARHEDDSSTTLAEMTSAIMSLGLDYFF